MRPDNLVVFFIFLATVFVYTFQRYGKLKINLAFSGPRLDWMLRNILLVQVIMVLSAIGVGLIALSFNLKTILYLSPFILISLLYVGKFPFHFPFNLRDIPFAKAHLIALTWAGMTTIIPLVEEQIVWQNSFLIFFLAVYLFIFSLAVVFDIRDINVDEPEKKTVPQLLGIKGALIVSAAACISAFVLFFVLAKFDVVFFILLLLIILTFISSADKKKDDLFYSFYLDGLIVLTGGALYYLAS